MSTIKLLSYNAQVGIAMSNPRHYVLKSWRHFLPHPGRLHTLSGVAELIAPYDLVALQEIDTGSLRSRHNLLDYLAQQARFPYRIQQITRSLGPLAQQGKGVLSRLPIHQAEECKLPGGRGRGLLTLRIGHPSNYVLIVNAHLSLGPRAQQEQLTFIQQLIEPHTHVIVMGDLNLPPHRILQHPLIQSGLLTFTEAPATYPSWRPTKCLDYILYSPSLHCREVKVLPCGYSDHLPITATFELPTHLPSHYAVYP